MRIQAIGYYKEFSDSDKDAPSIYQVIQSEESIEEGLILAYLEKGHVYMAVPNVVTDPLHPERIVIGNCSVITDGAWIWSQYLPYLIRTYHVALDPNFVEHIRRRQGKMVEENAIDWAQLDKQFLGFIDAE